MEGKSAVNQVIELWWQFHC